MPWIYLLAAAGLLLLLRFLLAVISATESVAAKVEERRGNRDLRERVGRFTQ